MPLNRLFRSTAFAVLRFSGLPCLIREIWRRNKVTIVVYHGLEPARADVHFAALRRRYNVMSLSDFLAARSSQTTQRLPPKALIITFDDGHRSNYALTSVIQRHRVPITIFLCSGIVGTHRHYWWFHTRETGESAACKRMADAERLAFLSSRGYQEERDYPDRQALSRREIDALRPWVDFQPHTITHPILPACSDEKAEREIRDCKAQLERDYGFNVRALAFPNGDYTQREVNLARNAGYGCALTLDYGFNDQNTDPFRLRRVPLPDYASVSELLVKTSGLWGFLRLLGATQSRFAFRRQKSCEGDRTMSRAGKRVPTRSSRPGRLA